EQVSRDAQALVDDAGVEDHVGVDPLRTQHPRRHPLHLHRQLALLRPASSLYQRGARAISDLSLVTGDAPVPCVCFCASGKSWPRAHDLASYAGELHLACPSCAGGAVRLLLGPAEAVTVPPAAQAGAATTSPHYSTDDEVEPDLIDDDPDGGLGHYELLQELG